MPGALVRYGAPRSDFAESARKGGNPATQTYTHDSQDTPVDR